MEGKEGDDRCEDLCVTSNRSPLRHSRFAFRSPISNLIPILSSHIHHHYVVLCPPNCRWRPRHRLDGTFLCLHEVPLLTYFRLGTTSSRSSSHPARTSTASTGTTAKATLWVSRMVQKWAAVQARVLCIFFARRQNSGLWLSHIVPRSFISQTSLSLPRVSTSSLAAESSRLVRLFSVLASSKIYVSLCSRHRVRFIHTFRSKDHWRVRSSLVI